MFHQYGFPPLALDIDQNYIETAEDYEKFLAANEKEDRLQVEQAMKELEQKKQREENER